MSHFIRKHKHEIGLSPDELLFIGKKKLDKVLLRVIDFDQTEMEEVTLSDVKDVLKYQKKDSVTWFNVDGLDNQTLMREIAKGFQLDKVILSDVMNTGSRPKLEEHTNCLFLSIKMVQVDKDTGAFSVENLSLVLTKSVLISFQEVKGDVFEPVRDRIRKQKKIIRGSGTDYLAFALLDIVVDNYIYAISMLGDKIEELEETLSENPPKGVIEKINHYKKELNILRRTIKPAHDMILSLVKLESDLIADTSEVHFNRLLANSSLANDYSESYREILSDQLNIYHTTISSKLNDIMKFLTIFSVIFIPLTFIAGIYGTNFDFVPELHYKYSYFIMWGVMLVMAIAMLIYFRKKKWL
ncbi:magnesium/cobalt transporter CorA [bacterium]|nr:magnesium/cobalt transporter CorA [bacterium]